MNLKRKKKKNITCGNSVSSIIEVSVLILYSVHKPLLGQLSIYFTQVTTVNSALMGNFRNPT